MITERSHIEVSGIPVEIRRKAIKNLHVGVYPPHGKVRVAAPPYLDDEAVRMAIVSRLSWIRRQQQGFVRQARQSAREIVTGESHYFGGRRYRLDVVERQGNPRVRVVNNSTLELQVRTGTDWVTRQQTLDRWYRREIKARIPELLAVWEPVVGVEVADCRIKRMKTRWGSCNIGARRVWLNLELAKKSPRCLEYILVHEMVHLLERHHTERFRALMDQCMPDWRLRKDELNETPLAHDDWGY
ncbi:M48 family metallopeptidase [Chromohalobacter israelensis]|uniref:M48 family metallopeptidase n=1 Tax=Chromohalobacter israelensis TaxID=141390 RepID=UPI0009FE21C9|nr:SprT family zinc-dependent metalloprotease [Chromohalobacter israelensis]MDF9434780.1 M48 family metallopeptidase [Chromohalobacter israelensis]